MELEFSSQHNEVDVSGQQRRHNNSPGIRIVRNRVNDSTNGISCHQCRQKTRQFAASCKNPRDGKPCVIKFCHKCLLNRYGEEAQKVELLSDWICPKCRGICNCSCCMKKRGQQPTGALVHAAKASGFKSVSEMLESKTSENLELNKVNDDVVLPTNDTTFEKEQKLNCVDNLSSNKVLASKDVSPIKPIILEKELAVDLSWEPGKPNSIGGNTALKLDYLKVQKTAPEKSTKRKLGGGGPVANDFFFDPVTLAPKSNFLNTEQFYVSQETHQRTLNGTVAIDDCDNAGFKFPTGISRSLEVSKCTMNSEREKTEEEIPLPPGTELTEILNIEFPPEDVGNALQFLEFCRVFGMALDVKKEEAEAVLRELIQKQNLSHGQDTLIVQVQIRLLTLILIDSGNESPSLTTTNGNNSWLKALEDLISPSDLVLKEFPLDWLDEGIDGYHDLDLSKKLSLLNFICDETLNTEKLRCHIDDQNLKFAEEKKDAKSKVAAAKEKERCLKQKLHNEIAKAMVSNVASLPMSKHDALSKIRSEATEAHREVLEAMGKIPKRKQSSDAMRTEPEFLDSSGQAFWKLKSYNGDDAVLLQEIKIQDAAATATGERWFVYGPEKKDEIDKYISSRAKRSKVHKARKARHMLSNESNVASM